MLVLEVEYLLGRVVSARHDDRRIVEWPPHPVRLFAALVGAFHESDLAEESHPLHYLAEAALRWLEQQPAPSLYAEPPECDSGMRDAPDVFVPMNDANSLDVLPERRSRQVRWFPSFVPTDPLIRFLWPEIEVSPEVAQGLSALAERVSYLGHSMSPVRIALTDTTLPATLEPNAVGDINLRTPGEGRLDHLRETYARRISNSSIQPRLGKITRYAVVKNEKRRTPHSVFCRRLVFRRLNGPRLPLESTAGLVDLVRRAVLDRYPDPLPEWISGHAQDGSPTKQTHLAIIPLPDVGHRHADGHLLGFALLAPDNVPDSEWITLEDVLYDEGEEAFNKLFLGSTGKWRIERVHRAEQTALRADTWSKNADTWASVTPVVFGHYPKPREGKDALAVLGAACLAIGLPMPIEARFGPVSAHSGVPRATDFVRPKKAEGKFMAHAFLRFAEPVRGPLLIGAGRYAGFGLMRQWKEGMR